MSRSAFTSLAWRARFPNISSVVASSDTLISRPPSASSTRATTDIPLARMAASTRASVAPCSKLLRTVITPSTFTCSAPALGEPENEGDDRQSDQHANEESTRHGVPYACGIHEVHTTIAFQ